MQKSLVQGLILRGREVIIPIKIGETREFENGCFVRIEHIEQGRYFHKIYIRLKDGKIESNKTIKILNANIFEFGNEVFIKGNSIKNDLVNGHEIL